MRVRMHKSTIWGSFDAAKNRVDGGEARVKRMMVAPSGRRMVAMVSGMAAAQKVDVGMEPDAMLVVFMPR